MIGKLKTLLLDLRVKVISPLCAIDRCEDRLQVVVVRLGKGIKLMVVALATLNRHRAKRIHRVADHFIAVGVPSHLAIDLGFRHFDMPDKVPRSRGNEAQSQDAVSSAGKQHITR